MSDDEWGYFDPTLLQKVTVSRVEKALDVGICSHCGYQWNETSGNLESQRCDLCDSTNVCWYDPFDFAYIKTNGGTNG